MRSTDLRLILLRFGSRAVTIHLMALAKVNSGATVGLDSVPIEVEVNIESHGFPAFNIVGLPDKAVEEAKEEVFREI